MGRRAHLAQSQQQHPDARTPSHRRRRHRHHGLRCTRIGRRLLGLLRHAGTHQGRRRHRRTGSGRHRQGQSHCARPSSRTGTVAGASQCHLAQRLPDRPLHRAGGNQGRSAAARQRRSTESAQRALRELRPVVRKGRAQLREHRWLGDHAGLRAQLGHHELHRRIPRSLGHRRARPRSRAARRSRLGVRARSRHREERHQVGRGSGRKAHCQAGGTGPLRSHSAPVAAVPHDSRIAGAPHRARSRHGLRSQLRRHQLHGAAGKGARLAQARTAHDEPRG